jgi:hypothetical protein
VITRSSFYFEGRISIATGQSLTLSELAAIAIIKNVPHAFGSEPFHSVGNPATIGVK